jgi:hypothetical protein
MVRATLSYCALFGSLIAAVALLQRSVPTETLDAAPRSAKQPVPAQPQPVTNQPHLAAVPREAAALALPAFHAPAPVVSSLAASPFRLVAYDEDADEATQPPRKITRPGIGTEETFFEIPEDAAGSDKARQEPAKFHIDDASSAEPQLPPEMVKLREKIRDCLGYYYQRPENVASRSPWGCMHWMIAYGVDAELIAGSRKVNAIGYLNYNGVCNGQQLFYTESGQLAANIGPGVQGHAGQYLAMLAQSRVKRDYPMLVNGQKFTVADLIEYEKATCRPQTELTFKLIALAHYLKSDEKWQSNDGETWDIPRLIKEELAQPIIGAACGGTHRLTGFSYAVRKRQQRGEPITGQWYRAQKFIEDYHEYTFKLQNPDGSFSTNWFAGREDSGGPGRRLETTGHITEWLAFSLSKEELSDPRMIRAVDYLTSLLIKNRHENWGIGPLGHGLHALAIYDERMFEGQPGKRAEQLAGRPRTMMRTPHFGTENSARSDGAEIR